jgi:arsenite methyltransferase
MTKYLESSFDIKDPDFASAYDELSLWSSPFGLLLFESIPLSEGLVVLDVGCWTGFPLIEIAERLGDSSVVCGIDILSEALKRVREKVAARGIKNVFPILGNGSSMPLKDEEFDLVVSNLGINNFDDPKSVFRECHRILKPGGRIILTTNPVGHMREFYKCYKKTIRELKRDDLFEGLEKHIEHRSTVKTITKTMKNTGFSIAKVKRESFTMRFLDGSSLLNHSLIKIGFLDGWKGVVPAGDVEEVFTLLEKNLNLLAVRKGELKLTVPIAYIEAKKGGGDENKILFS